VGAGLYDAFGNLFVTGPEKKAKPDNTTYGKGFPHYRFGDFNGGEKK